MFEFLAHALAFFYDLWPGEGSYGGAIALFTLAVMIVVTPLSIKTTRSMIAMQRVGPELKKLQEKHKGDREALNREMMAFYQENNINPFASCLPMLLQMPIFFVLYQVLLGLTRRGEDGNFNPKYLESDDSPLAVALRSTDEMLSMGMDLSRSAMNALQGDGGGVIAAFPYLLLVVAVVVTAYVQQRQIQGRSTTTANPQQQMIGKILPFIFIPISVSIPAGVVIYFFVSNAVRIGQQAVVTQLEYGPKAEARRAEEEKARKKKGGAGNGRDGNGTGGGKTIEAASTERNGTTTGKDGAARGDGAAGGNGSGRSAGSRAGSSSQSRNRKKKKKRK